MGLFSQHSSEVEMPHEALLMLVGDFGVGRVRYRLALFHLSEQKVQDKPEKTTASEREVIGKVQADFLKDRETQTFPDSAQYSP